MEIKTEAVDDLIVRLATEKPEEFWGELLAREDRGVRRVESGGSMPDADVKYAWYCRDVLDRKGIRQPQGMAPNGTISVLASIVDGEIRDELFYP